MSTTLLGGVTGGMGALGLLLVVRSMVLRRRVDIGLRVMPYLRDIPQFAGGGPVGERDAVATGRGLLRWAGDSVDTIFGGAQSVRHRLARLGSPQSVHEFRIEQVAWGLAAFGAVAAVLILRVASSGGTVLGSLLLCVTAFVFGVLLRDNRLSAQVRRHEARMLQELPALSELLALSVAAGEGPVAALERVVSRSSGVLSAELAVLLGQMRTGASAAQAFDDLARRSGLPEVRRFAEAVAVALERGTPLADLLHAQAGDIREAQRRQLIESGARKEIGMMIPIVFLVLPATVVVAFWPGVVGLSFVTV